MEIRKEIAYQYTPKAEEVTMTDMQRHEYEVLLKKRTKTIKKTTAEAVKRKQHTVGRLPLDKALEQLRQHTKEAGEGGGKDKGRHLEDAMKGWSVARIKAYKAIKTRPNAYYYRFNAPGEVQRVGQWTQEEQRLFHSRLAEIGANGQWGIFSMVIPGRVGYQCSNYYRYLIESKQLVDPNYVLDSKGKAHFLFTTKRKNADGTAVKEFRVHNRQNKAGAKRVKASGRRKYDLSDDTEEMTPESSSDSSSASVGASRYRGASNRGYKRRRMSDSDDEIRADDVSLSSDDDGLQRNSSDREYYQAPPRATGTTALGLRRSNRVGKSSKSKHGHQSYTNSDSGRSSTVEGSNYNGGASSDANNASSTFLANSNNDIYISDSEYESEDTNYNPLNPLPDFTDPITLEKVTKPAISPYGHVMDYDSWIRCLMFPPDGSQKNICPLTKKPLNKRELVILTHDNIEEYRDRIVNK
ncbi:hypothetical protein AX774_g3652 [Zancudomyces culisetae]|uniref:Myb-like domain-containing protein n=1 Tax=Zancudomyces culisetae TaxID=1213189 RepID=A0A1R1PPG7_ZANCU|nr:hypothetical protein AX774_g3652 [Zancudomyces culisetae]|eukprot:OMH82857.1 hypothetical protein AX774_g3652 [Zancudomyces culisetae]